MATNVSEKQVFEPQKKLGREMVRRQAEKDPGRARPRLNVSQADGHGVTFSKRPVTAMRDVLSTKSNRGDWTPLERFIAGVRGWEAGLRRRLDVD
jgi:hypothetical protein